MTATRITCSGITETVIVVLCSSVSVHSDVSTVGDSASIVEDATKHNRAPTTPQSSHCQVSLRYGSL
jgi:hypothetical protein